MALFALIAVSAVQFLPVRTEAYVTCGEHPAMPVRVWLDPNLEIPSGLSYAQLEASLFSAWGAWAALLEASPKFSGVVKDLEQKQI